jgi:deoxyribonuclease V
MTSPFDFYQELENLLKHVPENRKTTPRLLAEELGDARASTAIKEALTMSRFSKYEGRIKMEGRGFCGFLSEKPLGKLANIQRLLAEKIICEDWFKGKNLISGIDVAYSGDMAYGACVVMNRTGDLMDVGEVKTGVSFPYIPGYFTWREAPAVIKAMKKVGNFHIAMINGHGMAHPRGCGLASHVGLELDLPTIGVTKNLLVGRLDCNPEIPHIIYEGRVVGAQIKNSKDEPIYISVGHKISLETCIEITRDMFQGERLPTPLMTAHRYSVEYRRKNND